MKFIIVCILICILIYKTYPHCWNSEPNPGANDQLEHYTAATCWVHTMETDAAPWRSIGWRWLAGWRMDGWMALENLDSVELGSGG